MRKKLIQTNNAPEAIGPYSQAVQMGPFIFSAGQIGLDPATRELVPGGLEAEVQQTLDNLKAILESAGADWSDVVKTTLYLADMSDFPKVNELYGKVFPDNPPARTTIQAGALPKGARFEMDLVAIRPE